MEEILYQKTYKEYKAELDGELQRTAESFVKIGYLLKVARDTNVLSESGYKSVTEFAEKEYGLNKTQVSRFMSINDRFSQNGYSDTLQDTYKGFGYAKLTIMLQLPDSLAEELTPEYSKAEIQAIKEEVDEENKVSDLEVLIEEKTPILSECDNDLQETILKLGEDAPELYQSIWQQSRRELWGTETLQEIMAPAGSKVYSIRIPGVGRKEVIVKTKNNGNEVVMIDLRTADKQKFTWEELLHAWERITSIEEKGEYKENWEAVYGKEWPVAVSTKNTEVSPQNEVKREKKKESKVQKAVKASKKPINAECEGENVTLHEIEPSIPLRSQEMQNAEPVLEKKPEETTEEQIQGQMGINDFPEVLPDEEEDREMVLTAARQEIQKRLSLWSVKEMPTGELQETYRYAVKLAAVLEKELLAREEKEHEDIH